MAFLFGYPLQTPVIAALNHLLRAEAWARDKLAPFAGETVELRAPPLPPLLLTIVEDGTVVAASQEATAALCVTVGPGIVPAYLQGSEQLMGAVRVEGDPRLAGAVLALVRHLRWDAEEDLSRAVGDVVAHRVAQAARGAFAWQRDVLRRIGASSVDYLADEKRLLVRRSELDAMSTAMSELRDAIERLQKRVARLG